MTARVALVALALLVAGCSGGSTGAAKAVQTDTPSTTPVPGVTTVASTAVLPTPTGAASASPTPSASPVPTTDFGYFPAVLSASAPVKLSFDRAYFLTGDAAQKAAAAHGDETPVPNDYYIQNDNKLLRPVTLAATCTVIGSLELNTYAGHESVDPQPRTVKELLGFLATGEGPRIGFHLKYGAGGLVTRVEEQFVP